MDTWQTDVMRAWQALPLLAEQRVKAIQERKEALRAKRRNAAKARKEAGKAKEAARKASRDTRRDKRASLLVEAEGLTTRDLLVQAQAETFRLHWARLAVEGKLKLRGWRRQALMAAERRPMAARSDSELITWTIQANKAALEQAKICLATSTEEFYHSQAHPFFYRGKCVHAPWHLGLRERHIHEARVLGAPIAHLVPKTTWRYETLQWVGALGRLTQWKIPLPQLTEIAQSLVYYTRKSGEVGEGIRDWLTPQRVGDVIRVARRFLVKNIIHGTVPVAGFTPGALLRMTRLPSWLTNEIIKKRDSFFDEQGRFCKDRLWAELGRLQAMGRTQVLKEAPTGIQVTYLAPEGYSRRLAASVCGGRPADRWALLRQLKWGQYRTTLRVVQAEAASEELAEGLTLRAVSVFGNETPRWLQLAGEGPTSLHDHLEWLPQHPPSKVKGLAAVLFKYYVKGDYQRKQDLQVIASSWPALDEAEKAAPSLKQLLLAAKSSTYEGCTGVLKLFGAECARWGITQDQFDTWSQRWVATLQTPSPFARFFGKVWEVENMRGYFLPRHDARGLFLGRYTDCCQHPDGDGKGCAWHGQESPYGGFFVWENDKGIQAQAWVWKTQDGDTCFDNVECMSYDSGLRTKVTSILNSVARELGGVVTLGLGYDEGFGTGYQPCSSLHPADYSGYRDSRDQVLVYQSERIEAKPQQRVYTRMANEGDLPSLEAIARECFPEGMQFVSLDTTVLALVRDGVVSGYASLCPRARQVSDIAILPRARRHVMVLLEAMMTPVRTVGGEWKAECRETTSLPMMKGMEKRGIIRLTEEGKPYSWGNDRMVPVKFVAVERPDPAAGS